MGRFALIPLVTYRHVGLWTPTACSPQPAPGGGGGAGAERPPGEAGAALRWGGSARGDVRPVLPDGPQRARHPGCLQTLLTRTNPGHLLITGHTVIPKPRYVDHPRDPWLQEPHLHRGARTALVSEERGLCPRHETAAGRQTNASEASLPFLPSICSLFLDVSLCVGAAL